MGIDFVEALSTDGLTALRRAAKVDLHCHAFFGTRRENLEGWLGRSLRQPPSRMKGLEGMHHFAAEVLDPHLGDRETVDFVAASAVRDAIQDGVVVFEMSFDIRRAAYYSDGLAEVRAFIGALVDRYGTQIDLRPELGISRTSVDNPKLMQLAHQAIESGLFRSIDLYDHQEACAPESVKPLYAQAQAAGMKRKAHVGEFGGAAQIKRTVELLELDEVQHGIGASESVEVMRWLSENQIRLNVCPTSNVMLDAVPDLASHPIRVLFDHGVPVTINTDDPMIFGQSVSEEYRNLYQAGVFSAQELDEIRRASLKAGV